VVGALDDGDVGRGQAPGEAVQLGSRTVRILAAGHDERRRPEGRQAEERIQAREGQGRGDQQEAGEAGLRPDGHLGRDGGPERIASEEQWLSLPHRAEVGQSRFDVANLPRSPFVSSPRATHTAEVEPQGGAAQLSEDLGDPHDHGVFHVTAVERVRMAGHEAGGRAGRQGETTLQAEPVARGEGRVLLGDHTRHRIQTRGQSVQPVC
jgi:hypothetical protein